MRIAPLLLAWIVVVAACTQEAGALSLDVGGPCENDEECNPDSFCEEGAAFPDGMCSLACESQADCILSTICSDRGLCLMRCFDDSDCREGYSCIEEARPEGGTARACANAAM